MKTPLLSLAALAALSLSANAAVTWTATFPDWDGSETADQTITNNTVTVDGATFSFDLVLDGTLGDGSDGLKTNATYDAILMNMADTGSTTKTIVFNVTNVTQTSGPTLTLIYDGLESVETTLFTNSKELTAGGNAYAPADAVSNVVSFSSIVPDGTITATGTGTVNWRIESVDLQFSTAAVPEPSSAALLGLGGIALILRRRK